MGTYYRYYKGPKILQVFHFKELGQHTPRIIYQSVELKVVKPSQRNRDKSSYFRFIFQLSSCRYDK